MMTRKIFRSIFAVAMAVFVACMALITDLLYNYYGELLTEQLLSELSLAAVIAEQSGADALRSLSEDAHRFTLIAGDGTVLFDTRLDAERMESHREREEVLLALQTGIGSVTRYSASLTELTTYCSRRLSDGTVLRVSAARQSIWVLALSLLQPFTVLVVVALLLSFVLANSLSKKITAPLLAIDPEHPSDTDAYEELIPILKKLQSQHRKIDDQREELQARQAEFSAVTGSMNEGLVLLNPKGIILSMNPAACSFFEAGPRHTGSPFFTLERDHRISSMIKEAEDLGSGELQLSRSGRDYHLRCSRVDHEGSPSGVVILIIDITERLRAERLRREFTANVSHELKTPLQSIMGSAELLENGLVKAEDQGLFLGRIRKESARLLTLIEDILRLSRLDEHAPFEFELVDLCALAREELHALEPAAEQHGIKLSFRGEPVSVKAVRQLLSDILFNLADNAIKYNREGGAVEVTLRKENGRAILTVSDTGIGIPEEDQCRIFERFYRVDRSRSRQIGGTGLGLSIVKHAAEYLQADLRLESTPGMGTAVTVSLQAEE